VIGDWGGFRRCVDAFRNLADAVQTQGGNVLVSRYALSGVWQGNAADGCDTYLCDLDHAVSGAAPSLRNISDEYLKAADSAATFRTTVETIVCDLLDSAAVFIAAVVGGTGSIETGVGPVAASIVGLYEGNKLVSMIQKLNNIKLLVDGSVAAAQASMSRFGQIDASAFTLPNVPETNGDTASLRAIPGR